MDGSYRRTRQQSIGRYLYRYGLPTIVRVGTPCLDNHNPSGSQHHYESGHHRITPRAPPICCTSIDIDPDLCVYIPLFTGNI